MSPHQFCATNCYLNRQVLIIGDIHFSCQGLRWAYIYSKKEVPRSLPLPPYCTLRSISMFSVQLPTNQCPGSLCRSFNSTESLVLAHPLVPARGSVRQLLPIFDPGVTRAHWSYHPAMSHGYHCSPSCILLHWSLTSHWDVQTALLKRQGAWMCLCGPSQRLVQSNHALCSQCSQMWDVGEVLGFHLHCWQRSKMDCARVQATPAWGLAAWLLGWNLCCSHCVLDKVLKYLISLQVDRLPPDLPTNPCPVSESK